MLLPKLSSKPSELVEHLWVGEGSNDGRVSSLGMRMSCPTESPLSLSQMSGILLGDTMVPNVE